jgi:hypothetical protein
VKGQGGHRRASPSSWTSSGEGGESTAATFDCWLGDTTRNSLIHDGLLLSQTSKYASQLTHDDDHGKRHVSRVIHLQDRIEPSQIGISVRHGITGQQQ